MSHQPAARARIRQLVQLLSLLAFPITLNYFSPYVIVVASAVGVVNGSLILFALLFLSSLLLGRLFCSWICPAGAVQDICAQVQPKPVKGRTAHIVRWIIWMAWLATIAMLSLRAGGYQVVDPLYMTDHGISVSEIGNYVTYYGVIALFLIVALIGGKRAACHTICWMAPFMIVGRALGNRFQWPACHLSANTAACVNCERCSRACPMSLDVHAMVQRGDMEETECMLCGSCVDACPNDVISLRFARGRD